MTRGACTCDRAVIHFCIFAKTNRDAMTGVACRRGGNMVWRFAARDHSIVAPGTLLRRALKHPADMAGLTRNELMLTN